MHTYIYTYIHAYIHTYARPHDQHFSGFREPKNQIETIRRQREREGDTEKERKKTERERECKNARFSMKYFMFAVLSLNGLQHLSSTDYHHSL